MLLLLVSCFSVILLSKSLSSSKKHHHDHHPRMQGEWWRLFPPWKKGFQKGVLGMLTPVNKMMKMKLGCYYNKKEGNCDDTASSASSLSLLDLPELTLDCILDRLPPAGLCAMAGVCSSLRERCTSDHLWEKHMTQKWGKLMGNAAFREWQWHIASSTTTANRLHPPTNHNTLFARFSPFFSCFNPKTHSTSNLHRRRSHLPVHSIMSWYLSLETAKFCFPAQVYNRENGHAGFMLSCYDAKLTYDSKTDTFQARYSTQGRRTTEENIPWDRLRAPPVDTCSYDLHISDSLHDLKPGDHIEIQWRRNKEFPYGWWYGVVGHMESCDGNENHCRCRYTDTAMLEFKQYPLSSRWRKIGINRKDHREVGNEGDGFYGGIRKLYKEEEISKWKHLWPNRVLE